LTNRNYKRLIIAGALVALGAVFYVTYVGQLKRERDYVYIQVEPIQTSLGWGYEIVADGKAYIHQEFIPGLKGRRGFDSKEDAIRVGNRVISKIKMKQVPPAINMEDLKELGILKAADTLQVQP
jgi:hypothetical protein